MPTQKVNKNGLTKGQAIAATGAGLLAAYMLKPFAKQFVNELLWDGAGVEDLAFDDDNSLSNPRNLTGMLVSLAVGAVCKKSAAALIKNGPELLSSWGDEIMKHGGKALCRMHETIADAGSSVLDFAKDAIGLNADAAMEAASEVASASSEAATEAALSVLSTTGETVAGESPGILGAIFEKITEIVTDVV